MITVPSLYSNIATLHVECQDTSNNGKDIQTLKMTFSLPYFLVYQDMNTVSGSILPSSVRNNAGQPVFQVSKHFKVIKFVLGDAVV